MKLIDLMEIGEVGTPMGASQDLAQGSSQTQQSNPGATATPNPGQGDPNKMAAMQIKANQDRKKQVQDQIKQVQDSIKMQQDQLKMLQQQLASIK